MKVLLVDADSTIPNLALMKLSAYHKERGDEVELLKLNIPYYPNRKKEEKIIPTGYDITYCSVIFPGSLEYIKGENIIFGGTGYSLETKLPPKIENLDPDYSIYPDNDISYGFISRGCIRNCFFCFVPKKEGAIRQVKTVDEIVRHKKVKFLDNNFLALPNHKDILKELINKQIKHQFNQGLDIRLIDEENSFLLSQLNYLGEYFFAFDDWDYKKIMDEKLPLLKWRKDWQFKFFVYCNPKMELSNIINRIEYLRTRKILSYFMRDISCWGSKYNNFYTDLAGWCNQVFAFKKVNFKEFLERRHTNEKRIKESLRLYRENLTYTGA